MEVTVEEQHIIRHSLGLNYKKVSFRNHFVSGSGSSDYEHLESLVSKGLMVKRPDPFDEVNGNFVYHVTEAGAAAVQGELPRN